MVNEEIKYTNKHGDLMELKITDDNSLLFRHSDIDSEWHQHSLIYSKLPYHLSPDEELIVSAFKMLVINKRKF